jgi:hypothetical protein
MGPEHGRRILSSTDTSGEEKKKDEKEDHVL